MTTRELVAESLIFALLFVLLLISAGCGNITAAELTTDASGGAGGELGGRGGMAGNPGSGGNAGDRGGAGGDDATDGGGELGGRGGGAGGAGGGAACLDYATGSVPGFAFNDDCDGMPAIAPGGCQARCELAGAHFVGCVVNSPIASHCFASCSDCP